MEMTEKKRMHRGVTKFPMWIRFKFNYRSQLKRNMNNYHKLSLYITRMRKSIWHYTSSLSRLKQQLMLEFFNETSHRMEAWIVIVESYMHQALKKSSQQKGAKSTHKVSKHISQKNTENPLKKILKIHLRGHSSKSKMFYCNRYLYIMEEKI